MKRNHPYIKPIEAVLAAEGITDYEFGDLRKHNFVTIRLNGHERRITFPSTPGEHRGLLNSLAFVRRTIRTLQ